MLNLKNFKILIDKREAAIIQLFQGETLEIKLVHKIKDLLKKNFQKETNKKYKTLNKRKRF